MSVATASAPLFDDYYFRPPDDFTWDDQVKDEYPTGYKQDIVGDDDYGFYEKSPYDDGVGDEDELDEFLKFVSEYGNQGNFGYVGEDYPSISHLFDDGHHAPQIDSYGRNVDDMR